MVKFKVGDLVERIYGEHLGMVVGCTARIAAITDMGLQFKEFNEGMPLGGHWSHCPDSFKLARPLQMENK